MHQWTPRYHRGGGVRYGGARAHEAGLPHAASALAAGHAHRDVPPLCAHLAQERRKPHKWPSASELREEVETRRSEAAGLRKEISQLRRGSVTVWRQGSFEGV